ncbi:MAG: 30S ribosomal protein S6e [Candidatus Aenigmarchaeota archaeon]|nr:30S ribosomal protein S6e [Candidatus Aenigmarchaeota archaeon]
MSDMKFVINDPKSGKAYQKEVDDDKITDVNRMKIGEEFDGGIIDLPGYKLEIRGGTDKDGFAMRKNLPGVLRKGILVSVGNESNGVRKRKLFRGNTTGSHLAQINAKIVKQGTKKLEEIFAAGSEESSEEKK